MLYSSSPVSSVVPSSATSVPLVIANPNRKGLWIWNDSTETLYLDFGATASVANSPLRVRPDACYETPSSPMYLGQINAIWSGVNGKARILEFS